MKRTLNWILKYISFIEIGIIVVAFFCMYIPFYKFDGDIVNEYKNAFELIVGFKGQTITLVKFSFLPLLPYILLIAIILLVMIFDNKNNLIVKCIIPVLFLGSIILFFVFKYLLSTNNSINPSDFLSKPIGNIITSVVLLFGFAGSIIDLLGQLKVIKTEQQEPQDNTEVVQE